ncbi:MAG: M48 family metallopeptidase [Elusimicrobiota bacterium]|nr:M48 family metallopeptidase [Elusimicrobiota bacterium]
MKQLQSADNNAGGGVKMLPSHITLSSQKIIPLYFRKKKGNVMRLSVSADRTLKLAAPFFTSERTALDFIESKKDWIEKTLQKIESRKELIKEDCLNNDGNVKILGKNYSVKIEYSLIEDIVVCGGEVSIFSKTPADEIKIKKQYQNYYRQEAQQNFMESVEKFYPIVEKFGARRPSLKFKTMKSRWGSCNWNKGIIVLNYNLFKTPQNCIDYVVLHELTHLLYKAHDKKFYDFIEKEMPKWKECRNALAGRQ